MQGLTHALKSLLFHKSANFNLFLLQIEIAKELLRAEISKKDIVILTPFNAQVSEIREKLKQEKLSDILVTTITKSQGDTAPLPPTKILYTYLSANLTSEELLRPIWDILGLTTDSCLVK